MAKKSALNIKIFGLAKTNALLRKRESNTFKNANSEIHKQGFKLEAEVKKSIAGRAAEPKSVDTGHFLGSVQTNNTKDLESEVFSKVKYAKYLEFGTSRIRARRHFRNSAARLQSSIIAAIQQAIK